MPVTLGDFVFASLADSVSLEDFFAGFGFALVVVSLLIFFFSSKSNKAS